ncbi:PP2C family protein-serine/threonine phosphatase [Mycobacterium sp. B14F4]|uniref:PP2C family protein-serine/threonine phosphatase n=1 Tax=Mycobacterium sp. B14F4 TaxID=3153565 RepID=UPI00325E58F2
MGFEAGPDVTWTSVPHPVLVVSRAGVVTGLSESARSVLPGAATGCPLRQFAPPWLSRAHDDFVRPGPQPPKTSGIVGGREFTAHPTALPGDRVAWWLIEDVGRSLHDIESDLARERERATFLDGASAVLMASLNYDRCMEAAAHLAARRLAEAAVVVAPPSGRRALIVCSGSNGAVEQRRVDADPTDVAGLGEALRCFPPVPPRWIDPAALPDWLIPEHFAGPVGSAVITPLPGHGVAAGALVLLRRDSRSEFDGGEELFVRSFAARAGAALSAARLFAEQSSLTRTLMRELLPPRFNRLHGLELAGGYRASEDHELVGGDFYDAHPANRPEDESLVVLGDVCGKGLEAAVQTGKIRNTLQALAPLAGNHECVLRLLNRALLGPDGTRFATLVLASVWQRDGAFMLRLTCAGHPAPFILRNDGRVERADTHGTLVGVLPQFTAQSFETSLDPGETCLLYTDGVTEARGGPLGDDIFGDERLSAALEQCSGLPAEAVAERIMMVSAQWVNGRPHDDMAVVAMTAPRGNRSTAAGGQPAGWYPT